MADKEAPKAPERRYVLSLKVGGDTWEDTLSLLRHLVYEAETRIGDLPSGNMITTGGVNSGGYVNLRFNPDMDHEKYHQQNQAYLDYINQPQNNHGEKE